jgi:hypothetical protein
MAHVGLIVSKPQVTYRDLEYGHEGWRLSFSAKLANSWVQEIELSSGHEFNSLEGTVAFENDAKEAYEGHAKGSLTFWEGSDDAISPRPASYLATIRFPAVDLERLMKTLADGLPLRSVNVHIGSGMKYGWQPDGSGKNWDNVANPALEITGYTLYFGEADEEEDEEEVVSDLPDLEIKTDVKVLEAVREVSRNTTHLLYAIIALGFLIFFGRFEDRGTVIAGGKRSGGFFFSC